MRTLINHGAVLLLASFGALCLAVMLLLIGGSAACEALLAYLVSA